MNLNHNIFANAVMATSAVSSTSDQVASPSAKALAELFAMERTLAAVEPMQRTGRAKNFRVITDKAERRAKDRRRRKARIAARRLKRERS